MVNYVAKLVRMNGKHGLQLMPSNVIIYLLLFADDIVLVSDTVIGLQNQLSQLQTGADALGLSINRDKTKVVVFRNGGYLAENEKWHLCGNWLEISPEYRYLGALLTTKLSYNLLQSDLVHRAKAGVSQITRCVRKLQCLSPDVYFKMFDTQVSSILLYSAELWGLSNCTVVENVHLQSIKRYLNLPTKVPNLIVYGECGRYPLYVTAALRVIKYWLRILRMETSRYPYLTYKMMLSSNNQNSWAYKVKDLLCKYQFEHVWEEQFVQNERVFLRNLKEKLVEEYCNNWYQALWKSDRYSFYRRFKVVWTKENYLSALDRKPFRDVFIQFRTGFSDLYCHKSRYQGNEDNLYVCPSCRETFECEIHFLCTCPVYEDLRLKYLSNNVRSLLLSNLEDVLSSQDRSEIRSLAVYLYYAFKRRREAMATEFFPAELA